MCIEEKIKALMGLTYSENIAELSIALSVSQSTVRTWKTRKKIPERIINQANQIFAMGPQKSKLKASSLLISSQDLKPLEVSELKNSVMEGVFSAIKQNKVSLSQDVKIGEVADIILQELLDKYPSTFK